MNIDELIYSMEDEVKSEEETKAVSKPAGKYSRKKGRFPCGLCGRCYVRKDSLQRHVKYECDKEPQFPCPFCSQRSKRRSHQIRHIQRQHRDQMEILKENDPELAERCAKSVHAKRAKKTAKTPQLKIEPKTD